VVNFALVCINNEKVAGWCIGLLPWLYCMVRIYGVFSSYARCVIEWYSVLLRRGPWQGLCSGYQYRPVTRIWLVLKSVSAPLCQHSRL